MVNTDQITFYKCAQCKGWFQKNKDSQICCSDRCTQRYYGNLRKVSLKDKPQEDLTKGERVLREMRNL